MPKTDPLAEFRQASVRNQRTPCKVARALKSLDEAKRKLLEAALADRSITNKGIDGWARNHGITYLNNAGITSHRYGRCDCHEPEA